jgi:hypothetical protein
LATVVGVFFLPTFGFYFGHQLLHRRVERRIKTGVLGESNQERVKYFQDYYETVEYAQGKFFWEKLLGVPIVVSIFGVAVFFILKTFNIGVYFVAEFRIIVPFAIAGGLFYSIFATGMFMVHRNQGRHNTKYTLPLLLFMGYIALTGFVLDAIFTNSIESYFMN